MLNYIWVSLIVIGILVAAGTDIRDEYRNPYGNGLVLDASVDVGGPTGAIPLTWKGDLFIRAEQFNAVYSANPVRSDVREPVEISTDRLGNRTLAMHPGEGSPAVWRVMASHASVKGTLSARVTSLRPAPDGRSTYAALVMEPIRFVKLRAVTDAALEYAGVAVNISLGLIGIMALWLGVMKVAEEAGLLRILAGMLAPVTKKLFPEVPPDHPAVSAMIMNIAANFLGLSNAATPLGLKAMEELNRLNPRLGTATNAMCTFLAINTGGLVLIPATAIAVRAAAGSGNPGIIIGTSIVGGACATVAGVVAAKILQRLPRFRKALEADHG